VGEMASDMSEAADGNVRRGPLLHGSVLLAGEFRRADDAAVRRAMARFEGRCTQLTIAVVAEPPGWVGHFAPCSGLVLLEEVYRDLESDAHRRACSLTRLAPPRMRVEHLVTSCWCDLVRHARCRGYDTVLVAERPTRLRDRWLLRRTGWEVGLEAAGRESAPIRLGRAPAGVSPA
jgi:hypothetical protein